MLRTFAEVLKSLTEELNAIGKSQTSDVTRALELLRELDEAHRRPNPPAADAPSPV